MYPVPPIRAVNLGVGSPPPAPPALRALVARRSAAAKKVSSSGLCAFCGPRDRPPLVQRHLGGGSPSGAATRLRQVGPREAGVGRMGGEPPTSTEEPSGPLYTRRRRPTTPALPSRPTAPRTGPRADANFHPGRSRPVKRQGLPLGLAGLGLVGYEAAIGFTTTFSIVVVGVHIGIDNDGPFGGPRLANFATSTPHTSHRGGQLHNSLNGHSAGRVPMSRTEEQRRIHRLGDCMHQFVRRERALHLLPGIGLCVGLPLFGPG